MNKKYISGKYNPFKINEIIFDKRSGYWRMIPNDFQRSSVLWMIILSLYVLVKCIGKSLLKPHKNSYRDLYDNKLLFVLPTLNNQRALQKVIDSVQTKKNNVRVVNQNFYSELFVALNSLLYLPRLWKEYKNLTNEERRITLYYRYSFVFSPGLIAFYFRILKKYRPECVILSNDHIYITKSLELVCEDLGIKTIYVQHASVSYAFPELHFTYSFLDGKDSYLKYTAEGKKSTGNIIMLGAARYDKLSSYRINRSLKKRDCIGIAINDLDDNTITNDFCNKILEANPNIKIKIRSHPALKNTPFVFDKKERIIYTCATDEGIIDYLDSIDFQISGDSGVHFDAIIGGVNTVAFNFSNSNFSYNYGYIKSKLIKYAKNIEQVYEFSNSKPDISAVRFFDESYQKSYSGKCSQIITDFILNGYSIEYLKNNYGLTESNGYYQICK